jgi:hypothetical protein
MHNERRDALIEATMDVEIERDVPAEVKARLSKTA